MNQYNMTDKEQAEMIKKWWNDYGKIIAIAVVLGLLIAFGWRYWRQHSVETTKKASALYGQLGIADSSKQKEAAEKIAAQLMEQYRRTPYATMAALWWAEALVSEKNYQGALQKTQWVLNNSYVNSFKQVARLRTARILLYQKNSKAALDMLKTVNDQSYRPLIEELKGDIYTAMKNPRAATKAYQSAQSDMKASGVNNPILDMKVASRE